jgi:hypothetical protein
VVLKPMIESAILFAMQRDAMEQQYYVYLFSAMFTGSWQPYVKNYAHNLTFDYGSRVAALWLERETHVKSVVDTTH